MNYNGQQQYNLSQLNRSGGQPVSPVGHYTSSGYVPAQRQYVTMNDSKQQNQQFNTKQEQYQQQYYVRPQIELPISMQARPLVTSIVQRPTHDWVEAKERVLKAHTNLIETDIIDDLMKIKLKSHRNVAEFLPAVRLAFFNLVCVFIMCVLINMNLDASVMFDKVSQATDVIQKAQTALAQPGYTSILQSTGPCVGDFSMEKLGSLPGTSRGCICPDMTTSKQMCVYPCKHLESHPSLHFNVFDGSSVCTESGDQGFNAILQTTNDKLKKDNQIKIEDQSYEFTYEEGLAEFYTFEIAASTPCYSSMQQPLLPSQLSYPFLNKPYTGCGVYGAMEQESINLGKVTFGQIITENQADIQLNDYPFSAKYFKVDDSLNLYVVRKPKFDKSADCVQFKTFPFDFAYSACQFSQVLYQLLSLLGFCFFVVAVFFQAFSLYLKKKSGILSQGKLDEVMQRSTVIISYYFVIFSFIALAVYQYVNNQAQGIHDTSKLTTLILSENCLQSIGINASLQTIKNMSSECIVKIDPLVWILTASQFVYGVASYFLIKYTVAQKSSNND